MPPQEGSDDCGVFLCLFAACIANGKTFAFSQQDVAACRQRLVSPLFSLFLSSYPFAVLAAAAVAAAVVAAAAILLLLLLSVMEAV